MTAFYASGAKKHNRPSLGPWYLKHPKDCDAISFQLRHKKRSWKNDPIFRSGDLLIVVGFEETNNPYGSVGWEVTALDKDLNKFQFFWDDETSFRSIWRRP